MVVSNPTLFFIAKTLIYVSLQRKRAMTSLNIDGANYDLALWVAYYNFLRPHKHNKYKVLNEVEMLRGADNMPGKWQLLIFLGQQTILTMQKNGTASPERSCCQ